MNCKLIDQLQVNQAELEKRVKQRTAELERITAELRASNEQKQTILDASPSAIILTDTSRKVLVANRSAFNMFRVDELKKCMKTSDFIAPEDQQNAADNFSRLMREGNSLSTCYMCKRYDGDIFPAEISSGVIKDDSGKPYAAVSVIKDVSDQKMAEKMVKQSEEKYAHLFENSIDAIFIVDSSNGIILDANKRAESLTGYTKKELQGMNRSELHPKSLTEYYARHFKDHVKKGFVSNSEAEIVTKKGVVVPVSISASLLEIGEKKVLQGVFRDITERKHSEELLKASELTYKTLFRSSMDAIMTLEPPSWSFTSGNPATVKMFNCRDEDDFMSCTPSDLSPEYQPCGKDSKTKAIEMIDKAMKEGSNFFEWVHKTADGCEFPATVLLTRVEIEKGKPFLQATVRDITLAKKAEDALKQSEIKYRTLAGNIPGMIYRGRSDWSTEVISNSQSICGYSEDDFSSGRINWIDIIHPEDKAEMLEVGKRLAEQPESIVQTYRILDNKGRVRWVEDHKVSFFSDGKFQGVDGVLFDVTERKLSEAERARLHEEAKDRLEIIESQNRELLSLQGRLKRYSEVLEKKIKNLENNNIRLTNKEKLCLYGFVAYPHLNDRELSHKLNLNRSTITSIRNRLKSQKFYTEINLPNLQKLGCRGLTFVYGKFNRELKNTAHYRSKFAPQCMIHGLSSEEDFVAILSPMDMILVQKELDSSLSSAIKQNVLKRPPVIAHFPFELSKVHSLFDFSQLLHKAFGLRIPHEISDVPSELDDEVMKNDLRLNKEMQFNKNAQMDKTVRLNNNMKEALYAFIKYPSANNSEIAKKLRLARPTVASIKKRLLSEGLFRPLVIPNLNKLGFGCLNLTHIKFKPEFSSDIKKYLAELHLESSLSPIFISQNREVILLQPFRSYHEQAISLGTRLQEYGSRNIISDETSQILFNTDKMNSFIFDFVSLTRKLLGLNDII